LTKTLDIKLKPEEAFDDSRLEAIANSKKGKNSFYRIKKRSIDARKKEPVVNIQLEYYDSDLPPLISYEKPQKTVSDDSERVIIVGAGPAGMFAALRLIELGIKPILIDRGKDVRARRRDIANINKKHIVDEDSNYCFGEGGAGTYSDGKLYTRSKKRGDVQRILEILVAHGATEKILFESHPHIGTNKLPKVVEELRNTIVDRGGEVIFEQRVIDFILDDGQINGVVLANGDKLVGQGVILATGHSARDIFELLVNKSVKVESKPFALGVRVEHSQQLIDGIQYNCNSRGDYLPASSYSLVNQSYYKGEKRGVFSFCMCPGGFIVPAATSPGELVVNGMSPSRRDSKFANSGIVVAVGEEDVQSFKKFGPLAGLQFQKEIERTACNTGGNSQTAPAQRMVDFVNGKVSSDLLETSYQPGLASANMDTILPRFISQSLKNAFRAFGKKMKGYYTNEAQLIGIESRTSSPVRIPRDRDTLEHIELKRLFPCGEGAGYAGGIVSAAMDGERCAEAVANIYLGIDHKSNE